MATIKKLLIANRGEIAVRVIRTAQHLGYHTVAVFSDADRHSHYVSLADQAVYIGESAAHKSYLDPQKIITAAQTVGADAIHPGYGFLSENAEFSELCATNNLTFIGPPASAIKLMASKRLSKIAMAKAGVPTIPGYEGEEQSVKYLIAEAKRIGFPLMIKASAGGGGRGMRLVDNELDLESEITRAMSEAQSAFGSGEVILEKAVIAPRHIEIQVFADQHGNCIHLGERDCSVQRKHQKVVEEAPSPFITTEQRQLMGNAAVTAAKSCNYVGAGTVEFLVDGDGDFYFLEMNTRLQVEHPVTEWVTGVDLVAWQLQIAEGDELPLTQNDIHINGHAIEVRLYAENPAQGYMPQTGRVKLWKTAQGEFVRTDHNLIDNTRISSHYDSLQAKLICWGENRNIARRRLIKALEQTTLFGVKSNKFYLTNILKNENFAAGDATTAFIEEQFHKDPSLSPTVPGIEILSIAATLFLSHGTAHAEQQNWRNSGSAASTLSLACEGQKYSLQSEFHSGAAFTVCANEEILTKRYELTEFQYLSKNECEFLVNNVIQKARYFKQDQTLEIEYCGQHFCFENITHLNKNAEKHSSDNILKAPMDGSLVDILVSEGATVTAGQTLAVVEAMKMEHQIKAKTSGNVISIRANPGDQVHARQVLIELSLL